MKWGNLKETEFYKKELFKLQGVCELFYDQKEIDTFSSQLGNRLQKIDFDFPCNINAEINYLLDFLTSFNGKEETKLNVWRAIKYIIDFQKTVYHALDSSIEEYPGIKVGSEGVYSS